MLITECDHRGDYGSVYQYVIDSEDIPKRFRTLIEEIPNNTTVTGRMCEVNKKLESFCEDVEIDELAGKFHRTLKQSNLDNLRIDKFITIEV